MNISVFKNNFKSTTWYSLCVLLSAGVVSTKEDDCIRMRRRSPSDVFSSWLAAIQYVIHTCDFHYIMATLESTEGTSWCRRQPMRCICLGTHRQEELLHKPQVSPETQRKDCGTPVGQAGRGWCSRWRKGQGTTLRLKYGHHLRHCGRP